MTVFLYWNPGRLDPPQAPQGGTDQTAGVGRGDRQLDVLSGVRRAWRGSHGDAVSYTVLLPAGRRAAAWPDPGRRHRASARRSRARTSAGAGSSPVPWPSPPTGSAPPGRQVLHEIPERQHHAQRRPVAPSGDHALPDALDPTQQGVLLLPDEVTEGFEEGGLKVGAQSGDVCFSPRRLVRVGWDEQARRGGERIEEVGRGSRARRAGDRTGWALRDHELREMCRRCRSGGACVTLRCDCIETRRDDVRPELTQRHDLARLGSDAASRMLADSAALGWSPDADWT